MDEATKKKVEELWRTKGYPSLTPLYRLALKNGLKVTTKEVKTFLDEKPSTTLLRTRNEPGLVSGSFNNATEPFERCYMDLWDKHSHPSSDGYNYIMILLDSYTRKVWH
jgi:hypothetical protein